MGNCLNQQYLLKTLKQQFLREGGENKGNENTQFSDIEANLSKSTVRCDSGDWKFNWKKISI